MKVLLDEDLDHRLRTSLSSHEVFTVRYLGRAGLRNGELLRAEEQNGIDVFVTGDQNLGYQQNLEARRLAIVTLAATNWPIIRDYLADCSGDWQGSAWLRLRQWSAADSEGNAGESSPGEWQAQGS